MNRLTGDLVLEIRSYLDHESFYYWIYTCHFVKWDLDENEDYSSLMKAGRPMIQKWLSKYVDFPITKIHFGGTQGCWQLGNNKLRKDPDWLKKNPETPAEARESRCSFTSRSNYFLDFMSDHLDHEFDCRNSLWNKEDNWFEEVFPDLYHEVCKRGRWFETPKCYSYWGKLWFLTEWILTDAVIRFQHLRGTGQFRFCLNQYFLLAALERYGCVEFPPHDRMFAIPSVLDRICLDLEYQANSIKSVTAKATPDCNHANSFTILDMLGGHFGDISGRRYWGDQGNLDPHWEMTRDKSSGRLRLRWSFREPRSPFKRDHNSESNQDDSGDVQYGYLPWCGSSETSEETEASWALLQRDICKWIDKSLAEFNHEKDVELTQEIVEFLVDNDDVGDAIKMDDNLDQDGEALMTLLKARVDEASKWIENKEMRPEKLKQRVQRMKTLAKEGLTRWKKYFEGPQDVDRELEDEQDLLLHQIDNDQDFASWQSIGLSDRRRLRYDPVKFDDWVSKAAWNVMSDIVPSPSSKSLLQFAAEDLALGLSWRIEGANGEVAAILLGPHGSLWVKQEDRTIFEPFCVSDDDESYCDENSEDMSTLARTRDDPSDESIEEPVVHGRQLDPSDEVPTEEPRAKKQKLATNVTPDPTPVPLDMQQQLMEKIEAMESTWKAEVASLKDTNATLKSQLEARINTMNSAVQQEMTGMKTKYETQACEIQILRADLQQTRLDLAKAQKQFAKQAG